MVGHQATPFQLHFPPEGGEKLHVFHLVGNDSNGFMSSWLLLFPLELFLSTADHKQFGIRTEYLKFNETDRFFALSKRMVRTCGMSDWWVVNWSEM